MKRIIVLLGFTIFIGSALHAQVTKEARLYTSPLSIQFQEEMMSFGSGVQPATKVSIVGNEDDYSKHFKSWLMKSFGAEGKRTNGFIAVPSHQYTGWSNDSLELHYRVEKSASQCELLLLLSKGGQFLSIDAHREVINQVQQSLRGQIKEFYIFRYDEVIADQQREFERQSKDVEKVEGKKSKLIEKIKTETERSAEADTKLQSIFIEQNTIDQELKVLNATLFQDKRAQDQAKKEFDDLNSIILDRESQYNVMNGEGTLTSKEGKRLTKELTKLRKNQIGLQDKLTETNAKRTKSENAILDKEEARLKWDASYNEWSARKSKHENALEEARSDLKASEVELEDERREVNESLKALEELKSSKAAVPGL